MAISQRTVELHAALMCTGERLGYNFAKATRRQRYADVVHELKRCTGALSHAARREVVDELVMLLPNEDGDALMEAMADVIADQVPRWYLPLRPEQQDCHEDRAVACATAEQDSVQDVHA
jgi:hypothetical protein